MADEKLKDIMETLEFDIHVARACRTKVTMTLEQAIIFRNLLKKEIENTEVSNE